MLCFVGGRADRLAVTAKQKECRLIMQVFTWGCNDEGALGRGGEETEPALVDGLLSHVKIVQVSCGDSHTSALADNGVVYGWGTYRVSGLLDGVLPVGFLMAKRTRVAALGLWLMRR